MRYIVNPIILNFSDNVKWKYHSGLIISETAESEVHYGQMNGYPHLHVHSYYTLVGATPAPDALAQRAAGEGLTHLALTDSHALYGAVAFSHACREAGVQPILGLTCTLAWPEDLGPPPSAEGGREHAPGSATAPLVLLARNAAGYRSLCRLSSLLQSGANRELRMAQGLTFGELRAHAAGLLCLTGGRRGFAYRCLRMGEELAAHRFLGRLSGIFEAEYMGVSLELQPITGSHDPVSHQLAAKAAFMGLQTVAVQPIYSLVPNDHQRLRLLAAIDRNCPLDAVPATALPDGGTAGVDVHWLRPEELAARFVSFPDALEGTQRIAALCGDVLPDRTLKWPALKLPEEQTPEAALRAQAYAGATRRYGPALSEPVKERLEQELGAISRHGYAPLFLVVADIARYAREREIPISTRGSVANSLVAYTLFITTVDPLVHDLLFERFLNPGRADPPDIDLDFCSHRRDEVQAYIRRTYGETQVALVGAMSTLRLRSAARETAKAYGLGDGQLKALLAALPTRFYGPRRRETKTLDDVLASLPDPAIQAAARAVYSIADFPHHLSIHAGGLVITPGPLTDLVPVQLAPKGYLTTQYNHGDCEAIGLPKLDLLGIRALTVLADAAEQARQRDPDFRLDTIPLDDPETAALLREGDTVGVFQCDSIGARRTLRKLKAGSVQDLAIANAFFKPGPAMGGQADLFVRRYRGEAPTAYQHPALEPILSRTKGVLIFQEQVLRVATEIAGLSWTEADHIRRGMSRMNPEEMQRLREAFISGCLAVGARQPMSQTQAEQLWEQVAAFSGYGFNQGHATAYADVSYRSAYMKVHYPAAFFWARLRNYGGYHHPALYMAEAVRQGIDVRIPHVNHSFANVILAEGRGEGEEGRGIGETQPDAEAPRCGAPSSPPAPILWLGLGLIRDLRRRAVAEIVRARRHDGPFTELRDLVLRVPLHAKEILHLIEAGALDGLGANRPAMLREAESLTRAGTARQMAFDFAVGYAPPATVAQHLAWEQRLIGFPLSALREALPAAARSAKTARLADLVSVRGPTTVAGARLPGWHRDGYAVWDGATWVSTEVLEGAQIPPSWEPVLFHGHWRTDRWGMGRLVIQSWSRIL